MNTPFPINQVAVIGAGTMGRGIVISLANAGLSVLWLDCNAAALEAGLGMVSQAWAQQVDKQRITRPRPTLAWRVCRQWTAIRRWRRPTW